MLHTYKHMGGGPHAKAHNSEQLEAAILHIKDGESLQGSTSGRSPALQPQEQLSIAQHVAVLCDYGYAFDDLELHCFVKSFSDKAGWSVGQFRQFVRCRLGKVFC